MKHAIGLFTAAAILVTSATGTSGFAQPSIDQSPSGTQLLFLGTGGGPPLHADRSEPATLLIVDRRSYLIDCGIGTVRRLIKADIGSETIKTIFFTHLHPDHALGLADVMANDYEHSRVGLMAGESAVFDIYGPPRTAEFVDATFRYVSIPYSVFAAEQLAPTHPANPFHVHEIPQQGFVFKDDKIRVTAAENSHYTLMPAEFRREMKSYAYRIETPDGVVVFTGDTGPSDTVTQLAKGADVLVAESTIENYAEEVASLKRRAQQNHWDPQHTQTMSAHFTESHLDLEHVAQLASKAQVNAVLLYHGRPSDAAAYVAKVREGFSGPVFVPADLDRYCLETVGGKQSVQPCSTTK